MTQWGPAVPMATSSPKGPPDTVKYEIAATPSTLSAGRALATFEGSQAKCPSTSKPLLRPFERRPVASSSLSSSTDSTSASCMLLRGVELAAGGHARCATS